VEDARAVKPPRRHPPALLPDEAYRADILAHAYALSQQRGRAPGVGGVTFEDIEAAGLGAVAGAGTHQMSRVTHLR
jgi:uncharacterized glyoxalase superfamily metalloenzyme YdcJ